MAYIIMDGCQQEKASECVDICPVDCIEEGDEQYYIDPNLCIDCGACVAACPVEAIVAEEDLPKGQEEQREKAEQFFV
ncbi:4Fe-4S ferredoxin, iron-sulfur binding [Geomicrobium sp. JCM 19037]|uniref:indolepyruvate ferredoxin oxidoreductase subunit alpha n=1 Tax=unclassified Geomicrobium TaxID=2628951 RepID=UPI00045F2C06|nr:4Fe-4S dicluster domain-containing protein [Geomicrobium sp. JCM 19037]GAK03645.1 4Fe-4S ferredoxin, iron-sulfur binding [Geomicrobium sp. JCM 19037]